MTMKKAYDKYDREGVVTPRIKAAEQDFDKVFDQIKTLDADLANKLDVAIGLLVRAYEQQGFESGFAAGSEAAG